LRSQDYQPLVAALLENYLSDSSVGANEDSDHKVGDDVTSRPEASSATRPGRQTRVATTKQSRSKAEARAEVAKTAKLEAKKKKRKRKTDPTSKSQVVKVEDEAIDDLLDGDNCAAPRLLSPATMRQPELERKTTDEDIRRIKDAKLAAAGIQENMPVKVRGRLLKPKLRVMVAVR
jgi:hypothetical protein